MDRSNNEMIYRSLPVETRQDDDDKVTLKGHFSTFNDPYYVREWRDEFYERIAPGAFEETMKSGQIRVMFEHGFDPTVAMKPLGKATVLKEDRIGASYEAELFHEASYVRDLLPAIRAGEFSTSFGFMVEEDEWDENPTRTSWNPDGIPVRTIRKVDVREFSVVLFPANPNATATVRSLTDYVAERRGDKPNTEDGEPEANDDVAEEPSEVSDPAPSETVQDPQEASESVVAEEKDEDPPEAEDRSSESKETIEKGDSVKMSENKMTVEERQARVSYIQERLEELAQEYDGDVMPHERQTEWDDLVEERREHEAGIHATEMRRAEVARQSANPSATEGNRNTGPNVITRPDNLHDYTALRSMAPEERTRKAYDNARRILDRSNFTASERSKEENQEHITKLLNGKYVDKAELSEKIMRTSHPKYREAFNRYLTSGGTEQRDMSIGTDGEGGFGVPFDLDPTFILTTDGAVNPLRQVARVERISGTHIRLITTDGVTVNRDGEAQAVVAGDPTLAGPEYNAGRVSGYVPFSLELGDAYSGLDGQLTSALAEAKAEEESAIFVTGSGDGLTGVQGLNQLDDIAAGSIVDVAATSSLASSDIYALDDALATRHRRNASFLANKPTYNAVRQLDSQGGADLWVRLAGGLPSELIGYSAREMSDMESQGDSTTNPFLILGDWRKYLVVDRIGMRVMMDDIVKNASGLPTGQRALVAFWWNGGGFIDTNAFRGLTDDGA